MPMPRCRASDARFHRCRAHASFAAMPAAAPRAQRAPPPAIDARYAADACAQRRAACRCAASADAALISNMPTRRARRDVYAPSYLMLPRQTDMPQRYKRHCLAHDAAERDAMPPARDAAYATARCHAAGAMPAQVDICRALAAATLMLPPPLSPFSRFRHAADISLRRRHILLIFRLMLFFAAFDATPCRHYAFALIFHDTPPLMPFRFHFDMPPFHFAIFAITLLLAPLFAAAAAMITPRAR
jgi:hypothetical protein